MQVSKILKMLSACSSLVLMLPQVSLAGSVNVSTKTVRDLLNQEFKLESLDLHITQGGTDYQAKCNIEALDKDSGFSLMSVGSEAWSFLESYSDLPKLCSINFTAIGLAIKDFNDPITLAVGNFEKVHTKDQIVWQNYIARVTPDGEVISQRLVKEPIYENMITDSTNVPVNCVVKNFGSFLGMGGKTQIDCELAKGQGRVTYVNAY